MSISLRDDNWRLGHRPGLDGLRGIAILLVLLLHWWPSTFPGGDTGVDLFFVLSGFLITRLLIEEVWRTGGIDLREFYRKRVRRLMPAATTLVLACVATPGAFWVLVYGANWARINGALRGGPLEHTWSLAIEEQFYLVWPLLLLGLVRLSYPVAALSLAIAAVALRRVALPQEEWLHAVAGTDTRADALLIGCALALAIRRFDSFDKRPWLAAATLPGWLVVVVGGPYLAGWGFTLTAMGWAIVLLWALETRGWLTAQPFVGLGKLSYSLYLWHYPVTWFLRDGDIHRVTWGSTLLAITASFVVAIISYFGVEKRLRVGGKGSVQSPESLGVAAE